jgi:hypothetical protein
MNSQSPLSSSLQSLSWFKMTFIPVLALQFCNLGKLVFFRIVRYSNREDYSEIASN